MKKDFKKESKKRVTSRGRGGPPQEGGTRQLPPPAREFISMELDLPPLGTGLTTRKTIEVPEDYFYRVKRRALDRRMKEKELWAEILYEYFTSHPTN